MHGYFVSLTLNGRTRTKRRAGLLWTAEEPKVDMSKILASPRGKGSEQEHQVPSTFLRTLRRRFWHGASPHMGQDGAVGIVALILGLSRAIVGRNPGQSQRVAHGPSPICLA
jgi:hypothetical protein